MASRYWVGGAADGDWSNVNNWSATRGGASGAAAPVTNDDVFIEELRYPIVVGMDNSSVDLGSLDISMLPGGQIGSAGNPLKIGVSGTSGISGKDGELYIRSGTGDIFLDATGASSAPVDALHHHAGSLYVTGGTVTALYGGAVGSITIRESATITAIATLGAKTHFDAGSAGITVCTSWGGLVTVDNRTVTTANVYGGQLIVSGTKAVTTANVFPAGKYTHRSSGTITTCWSYGGTTTADGAPYPFTITTSNIWAGSSFFKNSPVAITFTTRNTRGFEE